MDRPAYVPETQKMVEGCIRMRMKCIRTDTKVFWKDQNAVGQECSWLGFVYLGKILRREDQIGGLRAMTEVVEWYRAQWEESCVRATYRWMSCGEHSPVWQ